jgi:hypothetical protein
MQDIGCGRANRCVVISTNSCMYWPPVSLPSLIGYSAPANAHDEPCWGSMDKCNRNDDLQPQQSTMTHNLATTTTLPKMTHNFEDNLQPGRRLTITKTTHNPDHNLWPDVLQTFLISYLWHDMNYSYYHAYLLSMTQDPMFSHFIFDRYYICYQSYLHSRR